MSQYTYFEGWKRILERAEIPHVGTHGIRHRATTEIANSGAPLKIGMQLTAHKTVTQFMRYVHTEDDQVRAAAEVVASRRKVVLQTATDVAIAPEPTSPAFVAPASSPTSTTENGHYTSRTKLGAYRPLWHRIGANRATNADITEGSKRTPV